MNSTHNFPLNLKNVLGSVFGTLPEALHDTDSPETIAGWDSFQTFIMFQELEKQGGVSFTLEDLVEVRTVGDIKKLLKKYNVPFIIASESYNENKFSL